MSSRRRDRRQVAYLYLFAPANLHLPTALFFGCCCRCRSIYLKISFLCVTFLYSSFIIHIGIYTQWSSSSQSRQPVNKYRDIVDRCFPGKLLLLLGCLEPLSLSLGQCCVECNKQEKNNRSKWRSRSRSLPEDHPSRDDKPRGVAVRPRCSLDGGWSSEEACRGGRSGANMSVMVHTLKWITSK